MLDKSRPDGFEGTALREELQVRQIKKLVITGMQTELCIAATCRSAAQLGYEVTLAEDAHSTFDFEDMKAIDAIAKYNLELVSVADVKKAAEIAFG